MPMGNVGYSGGMPMGGNPQNSIGTMLMRLFGQNGGAGGMQGGPGGDAAMARLFGLGGAGTAMEGAGNGLAPPQQYNAFGQMMNQAGGLPMRQLTPGAFAPPPMSMPGTAGGNGAGGTGQSAAAPGGIAPPMSMPGAGPFGPRTSGGGGIGQSAAAPGGVSPIMSQPGTGPFGARASGGGPAMGNAAFGFPGSGIGLGGGRFAAPAKPVNHQGIPTGPVPPYVLPGANPAMPDPDMRPAPVPQFRPPVQYAPPRNAGGFINGGGVRPRAHQLMSQYRG